MPPHLQSHLNDEQRLEIVTYVQAIMKYQNMNRQLLKAIGHHTQRPDPEQCNPLQLEQLDKNADRAESFKRLLPDHASLFVLMTAYLASHHLDDVARFQLNVPLVYADGKIRKITKHSLGTEVATKYFGLQRPVEDPGDQPGDKQSEPRTLPLLESDTTIGTVNYAGCLGDGSRIAASAIYYGLLEPDMRFLPPRKQKSDRKGPVHLQASDKLDAFVRQFGNSLTDIIEPDSARFP